MNKEKENEKKKETYKIEINKKKENIYGKYLTSIKKKKSRSIALALPVPGILKYFQS